MNRIKANLIYNITTATTTTTTTTMPLLSATDVEKLLSSFPTTKLSYEVYVHKNDRTNSDQSTFPRDSKCFIIPKGRRCVAWATEWKRNKIFAVIEVQTQRNQIPGVFRKFHEINGWYPGSVHTFDTCFHASLTYGTVFGGVLFRPDHHTPVHCFSIVHVYWYKGDPIPSPTLSTHVSMCERMFTRDQSFRQVAYTQSNSILFGLPVLCSVAGATDDAFLQSLPYSVYSILYRSNTTTRVYTQNLLGSSVAAPPGPVPRATLASSAPAPVSVPVSVPVPAVPAAVTPYEYIKPDDEMLTNIQAVFIVRPNVQNDIYELFVMTGCPGRGGGRREVFHNFAHIPNYKTSVMMNGLFRNIRENERLDTMEESESEDEFENIELDKHVSLHKKYKIRCRLNKKFCRWVPISVVGENTEIIQDVQVKQHESRYASYLRRGGGGGGGR